MRELRRTIGELAIVGFKGQTLPADVRRVAREFGLGGVIFLPSCPTFTRHQSPFV